MSKWWKGHTEKCKNGDIKLVKDKELELDMPEYDEDGNIVQVMKKAPSEQKEPKEVVSGWQVITPTEPLTEKEYFNQND